MKTRDEILESLTAYIDGELNEAEAGEIQTALNADPQLRALEQQLRGSISATKQLTHLEPSTHLRRAVLQRVATPATSRWQSLFRWQLAVPLSFATAAALAVVLLPGRKEPPAFDAETFYVAQNMELIEDLDLIGLEQAEDIEIVENLNALEGQP